MAAEAVSSGAALADDRPVVFIARGLTKVYRMGEVEVHALRGVDLDLARSELVVLLGPSGSGKSTLLNILGGLDVPTAGTVTYRDHDLTRAGEAELTRYRREHVGFVFQFYNLISESHGTGERGVGHRDRHRPHGQRRSPRPGRSGGADGPLPGAALRRRAAAGGDRPRDRQTTGRAAV